MHTITFDVIANTHRAERRNREIVAGVAPELTFEAAMALHVLGHTPMTVSELADDMGMHPSSLIYHLDVLERAGMVRRQKWDRDQRKVLLSVTGPGKRVLARLHTTYEVSE